MARPLRVEFAGAVYHVMSRGNGGADIFLDDEDRFHWLESLGEVVKRCAWEVHGWVLMRKHYHLLFVTPEANLVTGMRWLQQVYTQGFNRRHRRRGHVLQGRYKAQIKTGVTVQDRGQVEDFSIADAGDAGEVGTYGTSSTS
ncbi:MAG: transposase [Verrucomicrobiales bacterium]